MSMETDEQIAARVQREKAVKAAWKKFKSQATGHTRRRLKKLPPTGIYKHDPETPPN